MDDLLIRGRKMWQLKKGYRMGLDTVLLAHFATVFPGNTVADLGTGVGALPLILTARAADLKVWAVEIQEPLAELARENMRLNNLTGNVNIVLGDLTTIAERWQQGSFHLVVSNPPYRKPGSGKGSPSASKRIATEEIYCTLSQIVATARKLLRPKGRFALVHKPERLGEIIEQFVECDLQPVRLRFVHPRVTAEASLVLIEGEKDSRRELTVEKPVVVYDNEGEYTEEMKQIFYPEKSGVKSQEPE